MPKEKEETNSWKNVLGGLAESLTHQATNSIMELTRHSISQITEEKNKMIANFKRMVMSVAFMVIGAIFLLVGIAIVVNEYFQSHNSIGYILVGLVVVIIGLALGKKNK